LSSRTRMSAMRMCALAKSRLCVRVLVGLWSDSLALCKRFAYIHISAQERLNECMHVWLTEVIDAKPLREWQNPHAV
jgi:hypothetical protein